MPITSKGVTAKEFFGRLYPGAELAEIRDSAGNVVDPDSVTLDGFVPIGADGRPDETKFVDFKGMV